MFFKKNKIEKIWELIESKCFNKINVRNIDQDVCFYTVKYLNEEAYLFTEDARGYFSCSCDECRKMNFGDFDGLVWFIINYSVPIKLPLSYLIN